MKWIVLVCSVAILAVNAPVTYIYFTKDSSPVAVVCAVPLLGEQSIITFKIKHPKFNSEGTVTGEGGVYRLGHGEVCTTLEEEKK